MATSEREWLSVAQFKERYPQLGRNLIYDAVRDGTLMSIRIGGKILIASDALDRLAEAKLMAQEEIGWSADSDGGDANGGRHE